MLLTAHSEKWADNERIPRTTLAATLFCIPNSHIFAIENSIFWRTLQGAAGRASSSPVSAVCPENPSSGYRHLGDNRGDDHHALAATPLSNVLECLYFSTPNCRSGLDWHVLHSKMHERLLDTLSGSFEALRCLGPFICLLKA
ncbi:hypothetical protein G7Y89_g15799 [Cudoniella acicularis]|uniref:Uncharacterized protein n=1 Tax=Cudoniella acicularis TaxID=354080 RepID=A0A8H4VJ51_9HELO|nr:hypothetical protein G7Y89_g15799 [Cudoniella acicularis]